MIEGETDVDTAIADLGLLLVVKPALNREFAEVNGTIVLEVGTAAELRDVVAMAEAADIEVRTQEKLPSPRAATVFSPPPSRRAASMTPSDSSGTPPCGTRQRMGLVVSSSGSIDQ